MVKKILTCAIAIGVLYTTAKADDLSWVACMQRFEKAMGEIAAANKIAVEEMIRLSETEEFLENSDDFADLFGAIGSVSIVATNELSSLAMDLCFPTE